MEKPNFPTIFTVLSIVSVIVLIYLCYWVRIIHSSDLFRSEFLSIFFLKIEYGNILFFAAYGIPIVIFCMVMRITSYYKDLQSEKMERILEILMKYHADQEDMLEAMRIFRGH